MKTAILIACWNGSTYLGRCLESLLCLRTKPEMILIVDDASRDDSVTVAESFKDDVTAHGIQFRIIQNLQNLGFTRTANIGMRAVMADPAGYEFVVLLNQDTVVTPEWLHEMLTVFRCRQDAGAVGCKIYYPDKVMLQHAGGYLVWPRMVGLHYGHHQEDQHLYDTLREVDFVTGAAMALRVECLRQVGIFDEVFSPGYYEDVDLCMRLNERGWRVIYCPQAVVIHVESASFSDWQARLTLSHRNRLLFALRWMDTASFCNAFSSEERAFIHDEARMDDLIALAIAYGRVLLMLQPALRARLPSYLTDGRKRLNLVQLMIGLREETLRTIKEKPDQRSRK
jgi:GT2 family glycosyltransferase